MSVKAEGKTTYFIYEGNTLLGQYTDNDGTIENAMQFLYDENGEIQGVQYGAKMYYYQKDVMGNVYTIRNESGGSSGAYKYEAYGHNFFGYGSNDPFQNINPIKYRGYYYDNYYGGYYNLSRYYNPGMGRFLNLDDPMIALQAKSDPDGMNLYTYCNNDPVNKVDSTGLAAVALTAAAIGKILLAAVAILGICWVLSTIINNIDYSSVANTLNNLKSTYKLNVSTIKTLVVGYMEVAYSYAKRVVKTQTRAVSLAVSVAVAEAKVKTIMNKDRRHDYWVAYLSSDGILTLDDRLSKNAAVSRIKRGLNVMSRNQGYAKSAAYISSGHRKPVGPERHGSLLNGYYWHYHIYKHKNSAHVFYV